MNQWSLVDFVARNTEITTLIAHNNVVSSGLPLPGSVEFLIHMSVETERGTPYISVKS